jgi:hypothetical protein
MRNEQLPHYHILNLSECGRFWNEEYKRESGYDCDTFDTWEEANQHIQYLTDLKRDPSYMVSILGYEIVMEHYIGVVNKVKGGC